jgi:hypothetical protein
MRQKMNIWKDDWKDSLKVLGSSATKVLATTASNAVTATREQISQSRRKREIVDRLYPGVIRELAYQRGIRPQPFLGGKPTIDDYKDSIASTLSLKDLIEFANEKKINIRDVLDKISKDEVVKEQRILEKNTNIGDEYKEVARSVRDFQALYNYRKEYLYQAELTQWLKSRFPNTIIELQRGSSRPDIVVNGIAIEVKGPTYNDDLKTIADKLLRYSQWFPKGIIIVLFNVNIYSNLYEEWSRGIKKHYPEIEIIKK